MNRSSLQPIRTLRQTAVARSLTATRTSTEARMAGTRKPAGEVGLEYLGLAAFSRWPNRPIRFHARALVPVTAVAQP